MPAQSAERDTPNAPGLRGDLPATSGFVKRAGVERPLAVDPKTGTTTSRRGVDRLALLDTSGWDNN